MEKKKMEFAYSLSCFSVSVAAVFILAPVITAEKFAAATVSLETLHKQLRNLFSWVFMAPPENKPNDEHGIKVKRKCRIWWPKQVSCCSPSSSVILFGWFVSCSPSLDIVVAFACDEDFVSRCQTVLEGAIHHTNGNLSVLLQEKSNFSIVGHCAVVPSCHCSSLNTVNGEDDQMELSSDCCGCPLNSPGFFVENCELQRCLGDGFGRLLELFRQSSVQNFNWIQLSYDSHEFHWEKNHWVPKFHCAHLNGQLVIDCDVHVIIYEIPVFGSQHYSLGYLNDSEPLRSWKTPKWVNELHQRQKILDLDTIILAINSVSAAKILFDGRLGLKRSFVRVPIFYTIVWFIWQVLSMSIALYSTFFYIIFQCLHSFLSYQSHPWVAIILAKVFGNACKIIKIRGCQILYWPVFLQDNNIRSPSCVEYAERAAFRKHSMWSRIVVDILLGNLIGLALLFHAQSVCLWVLAFAGDITNNLLRTGCVWLMGVPAGFKLNTELAEIIGMISLNVIQIWSTLWFFMGFCFTYLIKGLALSGLLFGATVPAAVVIDMAALANLHIASLHWLISLLYSCQIQALASLWRLFRGRKWNPLRKRLDSYQYSVEQHIVGSLLFTPLLLLLPTTSVFYIFFAIMNTSVSLACILVEITIAAIHATPYIEVLVWLVRRRRFPSGLWFEILSCQKMGVHFSHESGPPSTRIDADGSKSNILVSFLHSNLVNIGHIVLPHYRKIFSRVSGPFVYSLAYGVLSGRRIPSTVGALAPSELPWLCIPCKEYWRLCRDSVAACSLDRNTCSLFV